MRPGKYSILVVKENPEKVTPGGILIAVPKETFNGTIIAVGEGVKHSKVGQRIKYHQNSGTDIELDGQQCILLSEAKKEVIAIIE